MAMAMARIAEKGHYVGSNRTAMIYIASVYLLLATCHGFSVTAPTSTTARRWRSMSPAALASAPADVDHSDSVITSTFSVGTPDSEIILSWESDVADIIREKVTNSDLDTTFVVGLVGNPGSGKTTSCTALSELLDDLGCLVMPFDGYHYSVAELETQPNAAELLYRRGAPDTFDALRLQRDLQKIRTGDDEIVSLPGFDHEHGDPEPNKHEFRRKEHKIVLCEGLYLLHDDNGGDWSNTKDLLDYSIFVNADVDVCMERLKVRNQCIPGYTPEEIEERCERVDRTNAMTVQASQARASIIVDSAAQRSITTTISDGTPDSEIERSWEGGVADMIRQELAERTDSDEPYMMSVVGGPGCGKTTSCYVLKELLADVGCMVMPFDGYHIPIAELQKRDNAKDLIYRRGAPDTFDAIRLQSDLQRIRSGQESVVSVPGFDHAQGDPEEDAHCFETAKHRVVLCEGLYLLHDEPEWQEVNKMFDYSLFVNSNVDACIERLKVRNKCIPGYTEAEIEERCEAVDRVNAETVDRSKTRADLVVESVAQEQAVGLAAAHQQA